MSRVWLIDFDSTKENLALMRLSAYHKSLGDEIVLKHGNVQQPLFDAPDKVYLSCVFRWNKGAAEACATRWGSIIEIGGTGVDIKKRLPPEVEACAPDYDLYGIDRAWGFISRGCIRKCPWCVVPMKEGKLTRVSTAEELVGDFKEAIFLDNNFLALKDHEDDLKWLAEHQIAIDFNQALDSRLITWETAKLLHKCKWVGSLHIAMDHVSEMVANIKAVWLLRDAGFSGSRIMMYVLIGYDGMESDLRRMLLGYSLGVSVFPMGFRDVITGEHPATEWTNLHHYNNFRNTIAGIPRSRRVWRSLVRDVVLPWARMTGKEIPELDKVPELMPDHNPTLPLFGGTP